MVPTTGHTGLHTVVCLLITYVMVTTTVSMLLMKTTGHLGLHTGVCLLTGFVMATMTVSTVLMTKVVAVRRIVKPTVDTIVETTKTTGRGTRHTVVCLLT